MRASLRDEEGITGLETAVILMAFVVLAGVFSFAVLSAGTFATERSKEAIYSGLSEVQSTMEMRGSLIAKSTDNTCVSELVFTVGNVAGGEPIDVTAPTISGGQISSSSAHRVVIAYLDEVQIVQDMPWTRVWVGYNDGDALLEEGEMAEITVVLTNTETISSPLSSALGARWPFRIEAKSGRGATLLIERTTPAYLDTVMGLD